MLVSWHRELHFRRCTRCACVLTLNPRYDFVKAELLHTGYFQDNVYLHTTASFAAVCVPVTACILP